MPALEYCRSVTAVGGSLFLRVTGFPRPHSNSKKKSETFLHH